MKALVFNYTHWIGYHVVEALLNEGYKVYGLAGALGNENLADFFVRNSSFFPLDKQREEQYELIISIGNEEKQMIARANRVFFINAETANQNEECDLIQAHLLFGEWMPMDEQGFYSQGERIEFSSELFHSEGIYMDDFLKVFVEWLKNPAEFNEVSLKTKKNTGNKAIKLDKSFFVHENVPIGEKIHAVVTHYKKFHFLYPKLK